MTTVAVVITFLELDLTAKAPAEPRSSVPLPGHSAVRFDLDRVPRAAAAAVAETMYRAVGGPWHWTDRLSWSDAEWDAAVNRDDVEVWVARVDRAIAGYFQLEADADVVELKYFGLMPECTGRRIGSALLVAAIGRARALGKKRMTVNTCTLDHPAALPNYLKRGFVVLRTQTRNRVSPA